MHRQIVDVNAGCAVTLNGNVFVCAIGTAGGWWQIRLVCQVSSHIPAELSGAVGMDPAVAGRDEPASGIANPEEIASSA